MLSVTVWRSSEGVMWQSNFPASVYWRLLSLMEKFPLRCSSGKLSALFLNRRPCDSLPWTISYTISLLCLQCTLISWSLWPGLVEEHGRTTEPPISAFTVTCRHTEITERLTVNSALHGFIFQNAVCSDAHLCLSVLQIHRWKNRNCRDRENGFI